MAPGYDCSAAAALSCFHCFALQSGVRGAFDVRWCRGGLSQQLFDPWVQKLTQKQSQTDVKVNIRGSARVTAIAERDDKSMDLEKKRYTVSINNNNNNSNATSMDCDAVILAVGATAAGRLVGAIPSLCTTAPKLVQDWKRWRGVTCVAVRLFFHNATNVAFQAVRDAMESSPVVVCGPRLIPNTAALVETGFCVYDLGRLQDAEPDVQTAVEVDFFRADVLANMKDDDEVVDLTLRATEAALGLPANTLDRRRDLQDSAVVRARNAVSHFDVGSAGRSPVGVRLPRPGLYVCGDWVDRTGHASWSTEKAVVTGRQAAAAVALDFWGIADPALPVIPTQPDAPALAALRRVRQATLAPWEWATRIVPPPPFY